MSALANLRRKLTETYPFGGPKRQIIPLDKIDWSVPWAEYSPPVYTTKSVLSNPPWADQEIILGGAEPLYKWNQVDGGVNRVSFTGSYSLNEHGLPLNPTGRTGLAGRGSLGKWGPNHAADAIVTRYVHLESRLRRFQST